MALPIPQTPGYVFKSIQVVMASATDITKQYTVSVNPTAIVKCNRCKITYRADIGQSIQRDYQYRKYTRTYIMPTESRAKHGEYCATCNNQLTIRPINARQNDSVPCNRRCTDARGPECECQCGGQHHAQSIA